MSKTLWTAHYKPGWTGGAIYRDGVRVCHVGQMPGEHDDAVPQEQIAAQVAADVALLTAAPKLLKELKALYREVADMRHFDTTVGDNLLGRCAAAIRTAEGRPVLPMETEAEAKPLPLVRVGQGDFVKDYGKD